MTLENKEEFVDLYVDNIFNKSVETAFTMFKKGFDMVFNDSFAIKFLYAEELQEIVRIKNIDSYAKIELQKWFNIFWKIIGNEDYDWGKLEEDCFYKGIFHEGHKTIKIFWEVFHELPTPLKKQFLLFLTGSDRVPISGMSGIKVHVFLFSK